MIKKIYKKLISEKNRNHLIYLKNRIKAKFLKGDNYYCNCCNASFKRFLAKGNIPRDNAMCPNCMSLERTRVLFEYLKNETEIFKKKIKVLHFAPEKGLFDKLKRLNIEYIDGDINPALARNVIDITNIPYSDNYFDLIICSHVLGHVPDERKALSELKRVLSKNGKALIMSLIDLNSKETFEDPNIKTPQAKLKSYGEPDLERLYGLDFGERLSKEGFIVEEIDYRNSIEKNLRNKLSVGDGSRELIYKCAKI